ncbi:Helitron helicase, partial [Phytophthora megakarya]
SPVELRRLYRNPGFKQFIQAYNNVSAFTSAGSSRFRPLNVDESIIRSRSGVYNFAQVYINDPDMQARVASRMDMTDGLDKDILETIDQVMTTHNPYSQQFMNARNLLNESAGPEYQAAVEEFARRDQAGEARPEDNSELDIILHPWQVGLERIFETRASYDQLQYPLLFPYGEPGWMLDLPYAVTSDNPNIGSVLLREYES